MKTILVPVDLSEASLAALAYASDLAASRSATLHLTHVVDRASYAARPEAESTAGRVARLVEEDAAKAETELAALAEGLRRRGFTVEVTRREGRAAAEILRAAEELKAELIAMGTHGRSGLRHLLMGSVAESVMRQASCPVLTVRAAAKKSNEQAA